MAETPTPNVVTAPKVDHVLPEVAAAKPLWRRVRDCVNGQDSVKGQGSTYLPYIQPTDTSTANVARNKDYVDRAVFYGGTKRTLKGMVGQVFAKPAVLTIPELMFPMHESIDGGAVSIDQQAKQALSDVVGPGRCGLLADYPPVNEAATRQDLLTGRIRPSIQYYFAEQIINWRVEVLGGERKLTLVVLEERYIKEDDGYQKKEDIQWRVLRLVGGIFAVSVYRKTSSGSFALDQSFIPNDSRGQPFELIPFFFIGSDNNDPGIDDSPMLDMANLNIAHYRNSADNEELLFMLAQPTPVFSGLTQTWVEEVWKEGIALGSRSAIPLPEGGTASLLQINETTAISLAMEHKERQMVALGAKLVENRDVARTLGEAKMEEAGEASVLQTCAKNVSSAYTAALKICARYVGFEVPEQATVEEFGYQLNTDFEIAAMTVDSRRQLLAEWQGGALSFTEYRSILRRCGFAIQTDEDAQAEIDAETAKGLEHQQAMMGNNPDDNNPDNNPDDQSSNE